MSARRVLAAAAVVAVFVVGFLVWRGGSSSGPSGGGTGGGTSSPSATPSGAVTRTVVMNGQKIELGVGPVVVRDGVGLLQVRATRVDPGDSKGSVSVDLMMTDPYDGNTIGPSAVRLVDPGAGTVSMVARDAQKRGVISTEYSSLSDGPVVLYAAFAAPVGKTVDVLLPYAGYFSGVAVVTSSGAEGTGSAKLSDFTKSAAKDLTLPVVALDTFTEDQAGAVRTRTEAKEVTVAIATDVLFASGSAELGPDADAALRSAGGQIAQYSAGALTVMGHTDDVGGVAFNQDLSVRRAQAVADRLATLVDLTPYPATVEGRGESEPAVPGTSVAARAANRRVELRFTPAAGAKRAGEQPAPVGALPPAAGPVGTGSAGVQVHMKLLRDRGFAVTLPEVRRVGNMIVGEVQVKLVSGGPGSLDGLFSSSSWDSRGAFDTHVQWAANNLTLLQGGTRYYPLDYVRNDLGQRDPLADRYLGQAFEDGEVQTVTVVWPAVPGKTVTLDSPGNRDENGTIYGGPSFRLTDVPVVSP